MLVDVTGVRQYLEQVAAFKAKSLATNKGYAYNSMEEFVLKNGQPYENAPLPRKYPRLVPRECYCNSVVIAAMYGLIYVEGYALGVIPVLHAWCVEPGSNKVIDPTWTDDLRKDYFGIPFAWSYIRKHWASAAETACLIDNWHDSWPLLKEGNTDGWKYKPGEEGKPLRQINLGRLGAGREEEVREARKEMRALRKQLGKK